MFSIILCMTYFTHTTFSDSKGFYGEHQEKLLQETLWGNGTNPETWLLISVFLVLLLKEEAHVSSIRAPMSGVVLTLVGFLFVDDTDLVVVREKKGKEIAVYSRFKQAINFWNIILRVSGGTLKPEK